MNKILTKKQLSDHAYSFVVENGQIARSSRPGNFVTVRADIHSERIPLVVVDSDKQKGTLTLVVQEAGLSSTKFCQLAEGDEILDVVGPLGTPYAISKVGTVVCVGGGVGTVSVLPVARAMKEAGNRVVSVVAGQTKDRLVVVDEMRQASDELIVVTDDGSEGQKGLPVDALGEILAREQVDRIVAVGPGAMMEAICQVGKEKSIPVDVALNAIIVDGTGICGSCRLTIGGKTRFVCIDGPFHGSGNLVVETRPAAPRVELVRRTVQRRAALPADVGSVLLVFVVAAREGGLGPLVHDHPLLLRCQRFHILSIYGPAQGEANSQNNGFHKYLQSKTAPPGQKAGFRRRSQTPIRVRTVSPRPHP